jgi:hypothetical protein
MTPCASTAASTAVIGHYFGLPPVEVVTGRVSAGGVLAHGALAQWVTKTARPEGDGPNALTSVP